MKLRHVGLALLLLCLLSASVFASSNNNNNKKVRFDGHKLIRININTEKQRGAIEAMGLDVWSHESQLIVGENHVVVPPGSEKLLEAFGVSINEVMIEDVQKLIDEHDNQRESLSIEELKDDFFKAFHDFEEIVYETKRLASEHDDIVTYIPSIGKTIQGRDIMALYLHGGPSANKNSNHKRGTFDIPADVPKIVFTGGQHAREWIGPATVMYVLNELLTQYGTDTEVTNILNKIGIVIVPVSNPDGYDFSWTNNRLWRKNRRQISGSTYGVDLNRNWDSHWGGTGSSHTPSSDTYCGSKAFSEPETQALSQFISGLGNVIAAIDWHSYSQLILRPWGWTSSPAPGNTLLTQLGAQMKREIKAVHGKDYTNQASWELYYTTGSADDWFLDKMNITLSYTIELRDTGRYGFVLPASEIIPTGQESWAAAKMFIKVSIEELVGKLKKH